MCKHEGFYSCVGRYDRRAGRLVYFMVCDDCQEVLQPIAEQTYEPHFEPLAPAFTPAVPAA